MVSITYGHGFLTDCDDTTSWTENRNNMLDGDATLSVENNDYFKIKAIFDDGATDEFCNYEYDFSNISSDTYTNFFVRYKTSVGADGAQAKVILVFTDGTQTILDESYSTSWTVASGDITSGKTIDKIQLYAEDEGDDGTFYVYYDFVLLYKNTFTFPNTAYGLDFTPPPRYALLQPPSKVTDTQQNLGSRSATVRIGCDLDQGDWTRSGDYVDAEVFLDIAHNSSSEPWQWYDDGKRRFKVSLEDPVIRYLNNGSTTERRLELLLREYSLGDKSVETYVERFGLNL